jgi:hypothetical protein
VCEGSFFPIASPTFVVGGVPDDIYSNRSDVNLSVVLICIPFMVRDGEHFLCIFWLFRLLPLKKICLVQLPSSLLVH